MCRQAKREDIIEGMKALKELFPVRLGTLAIASSVLLAVILVV